MAQATLKEYAAAKVEVDTLELTIVAVPSASRPGVKHYIKIRPGQAPECTCEAFDFKGDCHHLKGYRIMVGIETMPRRDKFDQDAKPFNLDGLLDYWDYKHPEVIHALTYAAMQHLLKHNRITGDDLDNIHIHGCSRRIVSAVFRRLEKFGVIMRAGVVKSKNPGKHYAIHLNYRRAISSDKVMEILTHISMERPGA